MVGANYTVDDGGIRSSDKGILEIEGQTWEFWDGSSWSSEDETLEVKEDEYFRNVVLTISSKGNAASVQSYRMGIYEKLEDVRANGNPVWSMKGGNQYLFFSGEFKVGANYSTNYAGIKSLEVSYLELVGNIGMDRNGLMMMCCWRFKRMSLIILMLSKYPVREVLPGFKVVEWVPIKEWRHCIKMEDLCINKKMEPITFLQVLEDGLWVLSTLLSLVASTALNGEELR